MVNKKRNKKPKIPQPSKIFYINFKGKRGWGKKEQEKYAVFSSAVYPDLNDGDPDKFLKNYGYGDYKYDKKLSNKNTAVFHNSKTGETIMSFRGTDWTDIGDIFQNLGIVTGSSLFQSRRRSNEKLFDKVADKYGKDSITLTGHSAGGWQSTEVAVRKKVPAVVYNSANAGGQLEWLKAMKAKGLITHYSTNNPKKGVFDIVSLLNPHTTEKVDKKEGQDSHAIQNFLPEEEIKPQEGEGKKKKKYCRKCKVYINKSHWNRHIKSKKHSI